VTIHVLVYNVLGQSNKTQERKREK